MLLQLARVLTWKSESTVKERMIRSACGHNDFVVSRVKERIFLLATKGSSFRASVCVCVCVRFLTADTHGAEASRVISTELSTSKDCEDVDNEPEQNNNIKDGLHAHNKARNDGSKHGHTFDQRQKTDETEHPQTRDSGAASSAHGVRAHDDKEIEGIEVAILWVREVAKWLRTLKRN